MSLEKLEARDAGQASDDDLTDALRWRALMQTPRIRMYGSASAMSDLAKDLREEAADMIHRNGPSRATDLMTDAADEIERLRAEIADAILEAAKVRP